MCVRTQDNEKKWYEKNKKIIILYDSCINHTTENINKYGTTEKKHEKSTFQNGFRRRTSCSSEKQR